jgi:hypothetical protein
MRYDRDQLDRVIQYGREFCGAARLCGSLCSPAYSDPLGTLARVSRKAKHLWAATEGKTIFETPTEFYGDAGIVAYVGDDEDEELSLLRAIRDAAVCALHVIGYVDSPDGGDYGRMPSMDGMKDVPRGDEEDIEKALKRLDVSVDRLEQLAKVALADAPTVATNTTDKDAEEAFDFRDALSRTIGAFRVRRAPRQVEIVRCIADEGEGVEIPVETLAELAYGDRMHAYTYTGDLRKTALRAKHRMDAMNTPLTLVIDRFSMKIVRRTAAIEAR